MPKTDRKALLSLFSEVGPVFKVCAKKMKMLAALSWKSEVAFEFFKSREQKLPNPEYQIDKKTIQGCLESLRGLAPKLQADHPVHAWLRRLQDSYIRGGTLLLEVDSPNFYGVSSELYGNASSRLFDGEMSNLELAEALEKRLTLCNLNDISESKRKSSIDFASHLEKRLQQRRPELEIRVEVTDQMVAKVVAGMNRVKIRKDAFFSSGDLEMLWNHEIESHCLTAQNGSRQEFCDFLSAGGPRTTRTQEGLAVFFEVFGHTMTQRRFLSLCDRIKAVDKVARGASFIDLYRWYLERSENRQEAFYSTQRIFRGAPMKGGAPFTKDTVYLGGLLGIYNFLRVAVKNQNRILVESLVCGRIAIEDVGVVAWLRTHGLVDPPHFVPDWLKNWEALLSFFSLNAVLGNTDLEIFQDYFDRQYRLEEWDLTP